MSPAEARHARWRALSARAKHALPAREMDLAEWLRRLSAHFPAILLSAVLFALIAGIYSLLFAKPVYRATAKLYAIGESDMALNLSNLRAGPYLAMDYREVFRAWEVHEMVIEALGLDDTHADLSRKLTVGNPGGHRVLDVAVSSEDPLEAAEIANAYAQTAQKYIAETMTADGPNILSAALAPALPAVPDVKLNMALGFLLGAFLVVTAVTVRVIFDDTVKTADDIRRCAGLSALFVASLTNDKRIGRNARSGTGKKGKKGKGGEMGALPPAHKEALNTLCANLSFQGLECGIVMLASCRPFGDKSRVAMNILRAFSSLGKSVALVDANLRRSGPFFRHGMRFRAARQPGLSDYLTGACGMGDILHPARTDGAYIIPARRAANPLSLLYAPRFPKLLERLSQTFDIVLVNAPAVGVFPDAAEIAKFCDGALMVVPPNEVHQREFSEGVDRIGQAGCRVLGAVISGKRR